MPDKDRDAAGMGESAPISRVQYLDSLRGLASLTVAVFFHYVHFSSKFQPHAAPRESAPFYAILRPLYAYGYLAVDVFFILSGYIFCYVYGESIAARRTSAWKFFVFRFSRLYPVHFAMLCVTAFLIFIFRSQTGRIPVYEINGLQDFVFNVLFIQNGVIDRGLTFNGPSWSLSIEAMLYIAFFFWAYRGGRLLWIYIAISTGALMLLSGLTHEWRPLLMSPQVARGLIAFFLGALIFRIGNTHPAAVLATLVCLGVASWNGIRADVCGCWIAFGLVLLALQRWPVLQKPLELWPMLVLGDISLAMYLLHFPLQVLIMLLLNAFKLAIPYQSGFFLASYAGVLICLSVLVHYRFERPVQSWLRSALMATGYFQMPLAVSSAPSK